jgi:hypothetical protein
VVAVTWGRRRRPAVRKGAWPTIGSSESGGRNERESCRAGHSAELDAAIKAHKADIIGIVREDELRHRTGVIQSERQVFEMARDYFGLGEPDAV